MSLPPHTTKTARVHVCSECDFVSLVPPLDPGERARCPRCAHTLSTHLRKRFSRPVAYAISSAILALISLYYPFISFNSHGITKILELPDALSTPTTFGYPFLTFCFFLGVILFPLVYLGLIIYINLGVALRRNVPGGLYLTKCLSTMTPWVMSDIFIIGTLVALIKIMSLAQIGLGPAFVTFCGFAVLLIGTTQSLDLDGLYSYFCGHERMPLPMVGKSGISQGFTGCPCCGQPTQVNTKGKGVCPRCRHHVTQRKPRSVQVTLALVLTAGLFYIPSMAFPVMYINQIGQNSAQTVIGGVLLLLSMGDYPVAAVIFVASIMVPVIKVVSLLWLCRKTKQPYPTRLHKRMKMYRIVEFIGRWSMIDVFVVTILTTIVQVDNLMQVVPGHGIVFFALVVIITMIAAQRFDPRLLWDAVDHNAQDTPQHPSRYSPVDSLESGTIFKHIDPKQDFSR
ncbi:Intermembrane transport protein PqiA [Halomonadaceae bacterium LMG 33818]|uniref:PqiA/YebS family transporter subunit n=1 Tax=Cernens ardua TaxID=3402176 RepID=UPI003EDB7E42